MAGFRLIGALCAFWLILEPGWLYVISQVTDRQIMTVDSAERHYFFTFVTRLLLVAFLAAPVGFWLGNRIGRSLSRRPSFKWLRPFSLFVGWSWFIFTIGILLLGLLAAGQPGLKLEEPERAAQPDAAGWVSGLSVIGLHPRFPPGGSLLLPSCSRPHLKTEIFGDSHDGDCRSNRMATAAVGGSDESGSSYPVLLCFPGGVLRFWAALKHEVGSGIRQAP